jgi:hypothetical protein
MEHVHLTQSYLLANKVDVYLDVQPPVGSHVDIAGIVTIDNDHTSNRDMKLLKKPATLDDNMGSNSVYYACALDQDMVVYCLDDQDTGWRQWSGAHQSDSDMPKSGHALTQQR